MADLNLNKIGQLLKIRRINSGLSIRELASRSGISSGTISQLETGKSSPNLISLHALCEALRFPIASLFVTDNSDQIKLMRRSDCVPFVRNYSQTQPILEALITKGESAMWAGTITMPPHTDSGHYYYHEGEEFVFILNGTLTFLLEHHPAYLLHQYDTLYYPNTIGHRWENRSDQTVQFLIVSTAEWGT